MPLQWHFGHTVVDADGRKTIALGLQRCFGPDAAVSNGMGPAPTHGELTNVAHWPAEEWLPRVEVAIVCQGCWELIVTVRQRTNCITLAN